MTLAINSADHFRLALGQDISKPRLPVPKGTSHSYWQFSHLNFLNPLTINGNYYSKREMETQTIITPARRTKLSRKAIFRPFP